MKKKSVLFGMFLLICCLWVSSCKQEEVVIEQPSLEKSEKEETDKADGKEEKSSQESKPEAETIWVDVSGAVNRPGVYELQKEARVFEAVKAVGGFSKEADTGWLNQAALLVDGEKIQVYTLEETSQMKEQGIVQEKQQKETADSPVQSTGGNGRVNINTADVTGLQEIPGIGQVRAQAIADYREENGKFQSIEEIQEVPGIKGKTFEKIQNYITIE